MSYYIKVENGQAVGHPAIEENLLVVYGRIPEGWEPLTLVDPHTLPQRVLKQYASEPTYKIVDGAWTQVWEQIDSPPEIIAKYVEVQKTLLLSSTESFSDNFSAWVFNPTTLKFEPPVPKPTDGHYKWHGPSNMFKEAPLKPTDGKTYRFNFYTWEWEEII